jgi:hypothetical protein
MIKSMVHCHALTKCMHCQNDDSELYDMTVQAEPLMEVVQKRLKQF